MEALVALSATPKVRTYSPSGPQMPTIAPGTDNSVMTWLIAASSWAASGRCALGVEAVVVWRCAGSALGAPRPVAALTPQAATTRGTAATTAIGHARARARRPRLRSDRASTDPDPG